MKKKYTAAGYDAATYYASAAIDPAHDANGAAFAARDLIYRYGANANQRWPTEVKAKTAGRYLYTLAKLELI